MRDDALHARQALSFDLIANAIPIQNQSHKSNVTGDTQRKRRLID